jgi:hypothetical protein
MSLGLGLGLHKKNSVLGGLITSSVDFRILVNTANAGVSNSDQFQFTGALGDYDVEVWDSTGSTLQETITGLSDAATITIAAGVGIYELRVFPAATNGFNRIQFDNGGDKSKLIEIRNWGDIVWSTMARAFYGCNNLTKVISQSNAKTSNVTDFQRIFQATGIVYTLDFSLFDTSSSNVFLASFFSSQGIPSIIFDNDFSNVTRIDNALGLLPSLIDAPGIENLNISSVTNFSNFLTGTSLPTSRYDALLINYEAQAPNTGLNFSGGNSKYTAGGAAEAARTSLENTYNWTITDGGPA